MTDFRKKHVELKQFYEQYVAAANTRNFEIISELIAEEVMLNGNCVTRTVIIEQFKALITVIPDLKWTIKKLFIDGDDISARLLDIGIPIDKSFLGENKEQKVVEFTEFASYTIRNKQFVEMWFLIDSNSIIEQLGS